MDMEVEGLARLVTGISMLERDNKRIWGWMNMTTRLVTEHFICAFGID
jgi:hypothetical protein